MNLTLEQSFEELLKKSNEKTMTLGDVVHELAGRGYPILIILLVLPFCLPIQIPGFSTPFGLILAFMGLRLAFAKQMWWPESLLNKTIPHKQIQSLCENTLWIIKKLRPFLKPRYTFLTQTPWLHRIHGVTLAILALILALPLPIPLSNLLTAIPILCLGLGLLEDDGVFIMAGYVITAIAFFFFAFLLWYGHKFINQVASFF